MKRLRPRLAILDAAAALLTLNLASSSSAAEVKQVVPRKAEPFALTQVRLLDGPFRRAQELEKGDKPNLPERPAGCCAQIGPVPFFHRRCRWMMPVLFV